MSILYGLPIFRFPWTCLSPRSCVKAEGDLDGLYAAMGLGYFARCAMERAQWGAGQLSRTYEQQGTMATMVDGWNRLHFFEGLINVLPLQGMFGTQKKLFTRSVSLLIGACKFLTCHFHVEMHHLTGKQAKIWF